MNNLYLCDDKIFISIPAYEDEDLGNTILDCLKKAKNPERLVFGIALQYKEEPNLDFIKNQSKVIRFDVNNRPGIIQIRQAIANLITDEKYFLGLDAHSRFRPDWDEIFINDHSFLVEKTGNKKIAIGERYDGYLPNLISNDNTSNMYLITNWKLIPTSGFYPDFDTPAFTFERFITTANKPTDIAYKGVQFVSANCWFITTDYFKENLYPNFNNRMGEEVLLSMSVYLNGYDMYCPVNKHMVNASPSETTNRANSLHWKDGDKNWTNDDEPMCQEIMKLFFIGECRYYSFNNRERTVESYWKNLGFFDQYIKIKQNML